MITSQLDGLSLEGDVKLKDWKSAGLLHPSLCRLSKIATVDAELIEREMGDLSAADSKEAGKSFRKLYRSWV